MPSKNKTTSETKLPENQQANVNTLMQGAGDLYRAGGPKFYGGQTVAQPNANIEGARAGMLDTANNVGGLLSQSQSGEQFWLNPANMFNPSNIPGFDAAQKAVTQGVTRNLTEDVLPQIRSGAVGTGTYGGSRQGIAEGLATGRASDALAGQLAQMQMGAFDRGLSQYNQAQNRLPQTIGNQLLPSQIQMDVGQQQRGDAQANIDASRERWDFEQMAPMLALQQLQGLTGQAGTYGGTQIQTQKTGFNPMQALGGIAGLAGGAGALGWQPFKAG